MFLLAVIAAFLCPTAKAVGNSNIVAHWSFEEGHGGTAADTSGRAPSNNASLLPAENPPKWVEGKLGRALHFAGGSHTEAPDSPELRPETAFTLEAWVKADEIVQQACGGIVFKEPSFGMEWVHQDFPGLHNKVRAYVSLRDGSGCVLSTPSSVPPAEWHHLALTYDSSSGECRFFVDGQVAGRALLSGEPLRLSAQPLCLGMIHPGYSPFYGAIDEVTIMDRALSETEIRARYDAVTSGQRPPAPAFKTTERGPSLFALSNNRQIARNAAGQLFLVYGQRGAVLMATPVLKPGDDTRTPDQVFTLWGRGGVALTEESFSAAAFVIDGKDTLHLLAEGSRGLFYAQCDATPGKVRQPEAWRGPDGRSQGPSTLVGDADLRFGDLALDRRGRLWIAYCTGKSEAVGVLSDGKWTTHQAAPQGSEPVLAIDDRGRLHLAFTLEDRTRYLCSDDGVSWRASTLRSSEPDVAAAAFSTHPSMIAVNGHPLIVFQFEGRKQLTFGSPNYTLEREGGGSSIGFTYHDGDKWVRGYVARSTEFVVSRLSAMGLEGLFGPKSGGQSQPTLEQMWRPQLTLDKHGVAWVFWPDTARRHIYYARWMGKSFGTRRECRLVPGFLSKQLSVEKSMPSSADAVGLLSMAAGEIHLDQVKVPSLTASPGRRVPLIDLLDVSEMDNLEHHVSTAQKHPANPVMEPRSDAWDNRAVCCYGTVLHESGQFRMWYLGASTTMKGYPCGYATSKDGIHWERPNLGLVEVNGSKDNNIVMPTSYSSYLFRDDEDPDPDKRYKVSYRTGGWHVYSFNFSRDGVHWPEQDPKLLNVTAEMEVHSFYRDPLDVPERRWKIVGQGMSPSGRTIAMQWSPDLIHWEGRAKVQDPFDREAPPSEVEYGKAILDPVGGDEGQIYMGSAWVEDGMTLCLYEPMMPDGHFDLALAASRDGIHFQRINPKERVVPVGAPGQWDSGQIAVATAPLVVGDEVRLYYDGWVGHHGSGGAAADKRSIGLATLPRDRWCYVSPLPRAATGSLATNPIDLKSAKDVRLVINVDGLSSTSPSAFIQVEVVNPATDGPIPGFTATDCQPITESGLDVPVKWKKGQRMKDVGTDTVKLRFQLHGASARLYAFGFVR